ncbi:MAG TPA: circadian clock KaiB family protein [Vicinamibacteria bacterium]|nr:circadian clock KaiB family protein [Vicinamibacteria bacterium]
MSWESAGRILVVDGDEDHGSMLATVLQSQGYRVDVARSAAAGLVALSGARYGLILVHYGLPDRTGAALLQDARAAGLLQGTAELLFTGKPSLTTTEELKVLRKPIDLQDLVRQVHAIVGTPQGPGPADALAAPRPGSDAEAGASSSAPKVELALYVTLPWPSSLRAQANLSRVLSTVSAAHVRLSVCDLALEPERAERDNVLFSPTLVKVWPAPKMWILGDLSEPAVLTDLLALCGVELPPAAPGPTGR